MKNFKLTVLLYSILYLVGYSVKSQPLEVSDAFLSINAKAGDPLFTTYAAAIKRSRLYGDKAYKMDYYSCGTPLSYSSDQSGKLFNLWKINDVVVDKMIDFYKPPVVTASFADMALLEYEPWPGLHVQELFMVYSSRVAMVRMWITNHSSNHHDIEIYPVIMLEKDSIEIMHFDPKNQAFVTSRFESKKRLISNLYANAPYPVNVRDVFTGNFEMYSHGGYQGTMDDFYNIIKTDFYADKRSDSLNMADTGYVRFVSLHGKITLQPGESADLRYFRGIQDESEAPDALIEEINKLKSIPLQGFIDENIELYTSVPRIRFKSEDEKLAYLGALNLARGCMLPPSGETSHNFYVFSRNPLWGWGHGHQVLHESLSMLAYVYLDPISAQGSQRVYMEQQGEDGLIAYRHGPRGAQTYPHKGMPTTSAPFYSWINLEIYEVTGDKEFLVDAYQSGAKYVKWLYKNRDMDQDSTFEWGPYGIIENVRDWYNAVFQVSAERYLEVDKEDISDELECLDLSLMIVKELRSLARMAAVLDKTTEAAEWKKLADKLSELINQRMWDEETDFYYHVNRDDHSWFFMSRDLRRQEIIGFLPLWAEACPPDRAEKLIKTLTDPAKFWRKNGVPTLSADDDWYTPYVDYCCKWNGPVWLLWNYMVFDGLVNYGYNDLALELAGKMMLAVNTQLSKNHNYWESYSPDNDVLNCPPNYIWDAIIAKLLIRVDELRE
jgi:hypothetical protein